MSEVIGISGSLRQGSYNTALLRAAADLFPGRIEIGSIRGIPLYNADVEAEGVPEPVLELKRQLIDAEGLLLVSPEYNNSMPGVLKNAVDWLSRPSLDVRNVFRHKPVAVIGASPGGFGTVLAQNAWLSVLRGLGAKQWNGGRLMVSGAGKVFDDDRGLIDESVRKKLEHVVGDFLDSLSPP
jgi:chromate reductase